MYLRKCASCGLEANTNEDLQLFSVSNASKHGRQNKCKICSNLEQREKYNQAEYMRMYRAKNADKLKPKQYIQGKTWKANNRGKCNAVEAKRRSIKKSCKIVNCEIDTRKISNMYRIASIMSKLSTNTYHVDHIIPLSKGGGHILTNLQVVTSIFNLKKGNRNNDKYISNNAKLIRKFIM